MGAYLVDNPPARSQFRNPRREKPSGLFVLHSAENMPDLVPPDTGAERVAEFIRNRRDAGSYHELVDADSFINLVPWSWEAFHDGTGTNPHSIGISAAWQAHQLPALLADHPRWVDAVVRHMAERAAAAALWLRHTYGIEVPAERVSVGAARDRRPGFITHAELDPSRRSDPGGAFPWGVFLHRFRQLTKPVPAARPEVDPLAGITLEMIGLKVIETIRWCVEKDGITRRALKSVVKEVLDERDAA